MADLEGTRTAENLKQAFAGEAQANRRFLYFAEAETGHAFGHLDFLVDAGDPATGMPVGTTEENLKSAIEGETRDYTERYPEFARTARDEGFEEVAQWCESVGRAEKSHVARLTHGFDSLGG